MTKTTNYQLPQWEANDPVCREDFNQAMEGIDMAIHQLSYAIGSYTGNGTTQEITLGFRPRLVLVDSPTLGASSAMASIPKASGYRAVGSPYATIGVLDIKENGFCVTNPTNDAYYPRPNETNKTYVYLALR